MQAAAQLKRIADIPLIVQHAEKLDLLSEQRRSLSMQARSIRQAAFDDGMRPWAFRCAMKLKAMKPQDARRELEELLTYCEDLGFVRQRDLFS